MTGTIENDMESTQFEKPDCEFGILGAGYAGIGTAIALKQAGIENFVMMDKDVDFGGTWHVNTYPGVAVDLPGVLYTFHEEQYPEWKKTFPLGAEVKGYIDHCVEKYGLRDHAILGIEVLEAEYDEMNHLWRVRLETGQSLTCRFVIGGFGLLQKPKYANIPGLEEFQGEVMHTARWNHDYDYRGKRVAVIGTGASAVQVVPTIAPGVSNLDVYQRTGVWIMPRPDPPIPEGVRRVFRRYPWTLKLLAIVVHLISELVKTVGLVYYTKAPWVVRIIEAMCALNLRIAVRDSETRKRLQPRVGWGCIFPTVSNKYFPAFNRENVHLVTERIERVDRTGIWTADGVHREADMIVMATGFNGFEDQPPIPLKGVDGVDLRKLFRVERLQAFHGVSNPTAPNAFLPIGPYSFTGHSYALSVDFSARHLIRVLAEARARGATQIQVTREANGRYFDYCQERMKYTAFFNNNCDAKAGYFFDEHGDVPLIRPSSTVKAWYDNHTYDVAGDYRFTRVGSAEPLPALPNVRTPRFRLGRWLTDYRLLFRQEDRKKVLGLPAVDDGTAALLALRSGTARKATIALASARSLEEKSEAIAEALVSLRAGVRSPLSQSGG